ncbi:heavy metal translocating P-type ATPase [Enterococcus faecalis]|uniref:heavy metal translocating P-type ATPase n=1 Tax=Enterococcus faecalis TaxID=1351 RepID=UPI002FBE75E3
MLNYELVFSTKRRTRIRLPFKLTPDIKEYFRQLTATNLSIQNIHFYNDNQHISISHQEDTMNDICDFLSSIDIRCLKELYKHPILSNEETPYDIISQALYKKISIKLLIPQPFQNFAILCRSIPFLTAACRSIKHFSLDMSMLDGLAILVALITDDFKTASTITFLLNLGTDLEGWSKKKSIKDLEESLKKSGEKVWVLIDNQLREIDMSEVKEGDLVVFYEGNEILFDGKIIKGNGFIDESSITGEAYPIPRNVGEKVLANTLLVSGEIVISITNSVPNSGITNIITLINETEFKSSLEQQKLVSSADKLAKLNILGMITTFVITRSISKTLSFLMVDFSCAIKLSTPVAYLTAIKDAVNNQVVIKSTSILDKYSEIDTYIFDKTGTITTAEPKIKKVITFNNYTEFDVIKIGACLEEHVYHPIANALVDEAEKKGIIHEEMHGELYHIASKGIRSSIDGVPVVIGSKKFILEECVNIYERQNSIICELEEQFNLLYLGYDKELVAIFAIETPLRSEAKETIILLKNRNKRTILLTGDTKQRTEVVTNNIPFDEVVSDLKPEDKFNYIQRLKVAGQNVLMVGDGLNDSAAIALADVGVSMGGASDVTNHISDITLLSDNLHDLIYIDSLAFELSKKIKNNLRMTFFVNGSLILLGLFNRLSPTTLATFHNLTTFLLVGNSFKLNHSKKKKELE